MRRLALVLPLAAAPLLAQGPSSARVSAAEKAAAGKISAARIRADVRFLASDLLEGRGPATRGDELTQAYLAARLEAIGLEPAGQAGGYLQPFEIVGVKTRAPERASLSRGGERIEVREGEDFVAVSGPTPHTRVNAELVFVGYGIEAPEHRWDDYKGVDVTGKVLLVMNNDPEDDPSLFGGKARLYYGRWDYKYLMAARKGALGAMIIHTEPSAGYKWQVVQTGWGSGRERFQLPDAGPAAALRGWFSEDAARRITRLAGQDLDALRAAAQQRDFRPVPLGVSLELELSAEVQAKRTANVIGRLPGSDAALAQQAVIYTAHHDHLGVKADAKPGEDAIYNGALDNASGTAAMLAIAEAMTALPTRPKRSVYFAAVGVEEQGLLGSEYLAAHPPAHPGRIAANINIDGLNIYGRTRDLILIGYGKSNLDDRIKGLAAMQGRVVKRDQFPDKGFFYRSDQLNFARIGVPAAYADAGLDVIGQPSGWGEQQQSDYEAKHYHQVSDELRDWNLEGGVEDARLFFHLGVQVANAARMPAWKPGDEFEAARERALAEADAMDAGASPARQ
jgi:Zn-dependent M28 family amino/carboxypeptidase